MIILLTSAYLLIKKGIKIDFKKIIPPVIVFYLLTQSLSVVTAGNLSGFFSVYKDIVFSLIIYSVAAIYLSTKKRVYMALLILIAALIINLAYQAIIYFEPNLFLSVLSPYFYDRYLEVVVVNVFRDKYFIDIFDTALIPIVLYMTIFYKNEIAKILPIIVSIVLVFFAIVSNFRTHILMATFSIISSFLILYKKRRIILLSIGLLFLIYLMYSLVTSSTLQTTTIDRLLFPEEQDYATATSRLMLWEEAFTMFLSSPLFGIGLGNFYDEYPYKTFVPQYMYSLERITIIDPHNIFFSIMSESGLLGLISFIALLIYFVKIDISVIKISGKLSKVIVASFWSLFIFALLNPPNTLQYLALFWLLRALILKTKVLKA